MQVALYVRVSTDRQQHAQTIEQQVTQLQTYVAAREGWTVREEHIFRDDGHSGAKLDRPGLDALRDHAARAAFDVVLITAPDRLARNFVHQMVVLEELQRRGVRVVFCDRPCSDDPHEQLVTQIRGAVAEYERVLIADRMRRGRQARLRSGQLLPWTRAPYGYRLHPERPRDPAAVGLDTVAAAVVQDLFAAYAAGGVTLHTLAAQLTARGVPTPTGKPIWRPTTIRGLLTNPAYKGQAASGRLRTAPARRRKSALEPTGKGVSTTAHPPQEWITVPVPAVVAAEQFDLVQRRLAANQQSARRSTTHPYLLRGLPLGLHRGHPHRHRHPLSLLPLPGQAGAGQLRPLELLPGAVHPGHPARRAGVGGPVRGPAAAGAGHPGAGARPQRRLGAAGAAPPAGELAAGAGQRDPPTPAAAGGVPGRGHRPGLLPAAGPRPCRAGGRPAGPRAGGRRPGRAAGPGQRDRPVDDPGAAAAPGGPGPGQLPTAPPAGGAADRPGGGDRRSRRDPLRDPNHRPQHQDAILSLAYRLFRCRTGAHTPARPGPGRARPGRPTTAIAPSVGGSGQGRARPGRAGWCRARSAGAHGCHGRGGAAAWGAARPRRARSRRRIGRPERSERRSGSARWSGRRS